MLQKIVSKAASITERHNNIIERPALASWMQEKRPSLTPGATVPDTLAASGFRRCYLSAAVVRCDISAKAAIGGIGRSFRPESGIRQP